MIDPDASQCIDKLADQAGVNTQSEVTVADVEILLDPEVIDMGTKGCCDLFAQLLQRGAPARWHTVKRIRGKRGEDPWEKDYAALDHVYVASATEEADVYGATTPCGISQRYEKKGFIISEVHDVDLVAIEKEFTQ